MVTSAARGLGLQIARKLGQRDYALLLTTWSPRTAGLAAVQAGLDACFMPLDVRDPDAHRAIAAKATERGWRGAMMFFTLASAIA